MFSAHLLVGLLAALETTAPAPVDFAREVQPILSRHCIKCHGAAKQQGELRLDSLSAAVTGGNSGPAIVAGSSKTSLLIEAVRGGDNASPMPPEGPRLSAAEIATLERWIDQGAKGPREPAVARAATVKRSTHWAFQPLAKVQPPKVSSKAAVLNPIDQFILARVESAGLEPSPAADRATLIRRLSLDLTGLPPSPAEVVEFAADQSEGAYQRVVDRLLASPHYGERWGRWWLDQARYADSNGYTIDGARTVWKYRDWVVAALNRDLPFDRFTVEQIAGDMLPKPTNDQLVATGFHRNTMRNEEGGTDAEQFRVEAVVDRVSTTGSVFLGLTLGCARCHDHKYDPISQREFYRFFALLNNADEPMLSLPTTQQAKELPAIEAEIAAVEKRIADVDLSGRQRIWERKLLEELQALEKTKTAPEALAVLEPLREIIEVPEAKRSAAQRKLLLDEYRKHDLELAPLSVTLAEVKARQKQLAAKVTSTLVMRERKTPRETFVHLRGDFLRPGAKVEPGVPAVLPALDVSNRQANRLDLARWLVSAKNPLTPRVTMNRLWQQYFGQGLVATENDFGTQGERPTHPELLDWLASEFIVRGWSLKAMHRLVVTSATYRQASRVRADIAAKDPYNKLVARQARLRLDAEVIRDSALAASGLLSREIGGPGVYPPQPEGIYRFTQTAKFWRESQDDDRFRRGLYIYFWRSSPYPFLTTFDAPDATTTCTRRVRSNTPLQALTLANDKAFVEMARGLAGRVLGEASADDAERVELAFRLCLARAPTPTERERLAHFVAGERKAFESGDAAKQVAGDKTSKAQSAQEMAAWTSLARVLLNLDEFVTRE